MLGKALQDPVKGMTALRRAGVSLSDSQVKQIASLVKQYGTSTTGLIWRWASIT